MEWWSNAEIEQSSIWNFDLEEEAGLLNDCDRRANENFRMLDVMEERDAQIRRGG